MLKSLITITAASLLFLGGCGPENLNDADYLAQLSESGFVEVNSAENEEEEAADEEEEAPACPRGGCPSKGCPTGQCEVPPDPSTNKNITLPDRAIHVPVKIIKSAERQDATDIINYHTTYHRHQPTVQEHTVHKHRNIVRRHFKKIVNHPSFRKVIKIVRTASDSDEVMPTVEETMPVKDLGCGGLLARPVARPYYHRIYPVIYPMLKQYYGLR